MILWHNPRCSKSREALQLLGDAGVTPEIRNYLEQPPTEAELREVARKLGVGPRGFLRSKEPEAAELGLADADDDTLFAAMAAHPRLIERPIAVEGDRAVLGRPPEALRDLLG